MNKVRFGIIGMGSMGSTHAKMLLEGQVPNAELTAVYHRNSEQLQRLRSNLLPERVQAFDSLDAFLASHAMDAVLIATPHKTHPTLAIQAFQSGYHVLLEKPAGIAAVQVREMNRVALESGQVFGMMYNFRTFPVYQKARQLLMDGELGRFRRVIWIMTAWYRSQSYYDAGGWRATWEGEGGGVLLNQSAHQIDLLQWICGMPDQVHAFMEFGKERDIEVENHVISTLRYKNGASGLFVTSTYEAPGTNRLEISGTRGKLVVEDDQLTFWRNEVDDEQFNREFKDGFGEPAVWKCKFPELAGKVPTRHAGILANFSDAVLHGKPLIAPGEEGLNGVILTNAMHLSAWTGQWIDLETMDEQLFVNLLEERIAGSTFQKKISAQVLDPSATF